MSRSLNGVRRVGAPRIVWEPDDAGVYFVAEQRVDPHTLPTRLMRVRKGRVGLISSNSLCWATLGEISAQAWLDPAGNWPESRSQQAEHVFRDGDSFLTAPIVAGSCSLRGVRQAVVVPTEPVRAWNQRVLEKPLGVDDARLVQRALEHIAAEPLLGAIHARYSRVRRSADRTLPRYWWQLPPLAPGADLRLPHAFSRIHWSLMTDDDSDAALLIGDGSARVNRGEAQFYTEWFGIFCITVDGSLVFLGPAGDHTGLATPMLRSSDFAVIGVPGHAPMVLGRELALHLYAGQYRDFDFALGAVPRRP